MTAQANVFRTGEQLTIMTFFLLGLGWRRMVGISLSVIAAVGIAINPSWFKPIKVIKGDLRFFSLNRLVCLAHGSASCAQSLEIAK
jgi:hypothetical protein